MQIIFSWIIFVDNLQLLNLRIIAKYRKEKNEQFKSSRTRNNTINSDKGNSN